MTILNNQQNVLFKKLGLGVLNAVVEPDEVQAQELDVIIDSVNLASTEFSGVLNIESVISFSTGAANISQQNFVPASGYRIPSTSPLLSGTAEVRVQASGSNSTAAINGLRAELIPSLEIPTSCLGMVKCSTSGDTSFIISASGANFSLVSKLDANPNVEISLLEDSKKILVTNKNSNTIPSIFQMLVLRDEDIFDPSTLTPEELAELGLTDLL